ncbi:hypothetical protein IJ707_03125, partial [bacterium]|nr:hypothetical protein [bacterium]
SFTSIDSETGKEVFDQTAFDAENVRYQESVRAHDEAVLKKAELEAAVDAKTREVAGAETNYNDLIRIAQDKEAELAAIDSDMDMSMSEIDDLNEQIRLLEETEATEETEKSESGKPKVEVFEQSDGTKRTIETDPETGVVSVTITDAKGKVLETQTTDVNDPSIKYSKEYKGNVIIDTTTEGDNVTERLAYSTTGNFAEYDGQGNTKITVKAGESANIIYGKFYTGDANSQNRENLISAFRASRGVAADYNPSDKELKQYFYERAGFNNNGTKLQSGGILHPGQDLYIPTEINPDDENLQGRDANVEKAKGNRAEIARLRAIEARRLAETKRSETDAASLANETEAAKRKKFTEMLLADMKINCSALDSNAANGGVQGYAASRVQKRMGNELEGLTGETSFESLAYSVRKGTGAINMYGDERPKGQVKLATYIYESDIEDLYQNMLKLSKDPDNKELRAKVEKQWDKCTMRNFAVGYKTMQATSIDKFLAAIAVNAVKEGAKAGVEELLTTANKFNPVQNAAYAYAASKRDGNSDLEATIDMFIAQVPGGSTLKATIKGVIDAKIDLSDIYKAVGNSKERVKACFENMAALDAESQRALAAQLRGKTPKQKATIIARYANR